MKKLFTVNNHHILIDDCDYDLIIQYKWTAANNLNLTFYAQSKIKIGDKRTTLRMHRLIMGLRHGDKRQVDHINGNGLDNRRCNLRIVNRSQNGANRRINIKNRSKYKGVTWHKRLKRWQCRICISGQNIFLGYFDHKIDAAKEYDKAAIRYFGEYSKTNFPKEL